MKYAFPCNTSAVPVETTKSVMISDISVMTNMTDMAVIAVMTGTSFTTFSENHQCCLSVIGQDDFGPKNACNLGKISQKFGKAGWWQTGGMEFTRFLERGKNLAWFLTKLSGTYRHHGNIWRRQ